MNGDIGNINATWGRSMAKTSVLRNHYHHEGAGPYCEEGFFLNTEDFGALAGCELRVAYEYLFAPAGELGEGALYDARCGCGAGYPPAGLPH